MEYQQMPAAHLVQVRKPKAIVFDILGTASKSGFLDKILFPFLSMNLESYITSHWNHDDFIKVYKRMIEQSKDLNKQDPSCPVLAGHGAEEAKQTLLQFINYVTERNAQAPGVTRLRFMVWFEGYQQSKLRTPIYKDVPERIRQWYADGIKFYVFSNTWVEAQKALLRNTNHGDLTSLISGHYDNDFGQLNDPESWRRLCATEIRQPAQDVLFLTKAPLEARAASEAGLACVLVLTHRHNVKAVNQEDRHRFPYVRTLLDLDWVVEGPASTAAIASSNVSKTSRELKGPMSSGSRSGSSKISQTGSKAGSKVRASRHSSATSSTNATSATGATSATSATNATGSTTVTVPSGLTEEQQQQSQQPQ